MHYFITALSSANAGHRDDARAQACQQRRQAALSASDAMRLSTQLRDQCRSSSRIARTKAVPIGKPAAKAFTLNTPVGWQTLRPTPDAPAPVESAQLTGKGIAQVSAALPPGQAERLRVVAKWAVTLEPPGGSPEGKAAGPVILIGEIKV